jgi:hypothetical protein
MEWSGGCLCGAVHYRATADPIRLSIATVDCHCGMCRRTSGAAFPTFVHFAGARFTWTEGEPTRYRSSSDAERGICARCGSTLTEHEAVLDDRVQVALGSLDHSERVTPDDHVWTEGQLGWLRIEDGLLRHPRISPAAPSRALESE